MQISLSKLPNYLHRLHLILNEIFKLVFVSISNTIKAWWTNDFFFESLVEIGSFFTPNKHIDKIDFRKTIEELFKQYLSKEASSTSKKQSLTLVVVFEWHFSTLSILWLISIVIMTS